MHVKLRKITLAICRRNRILIFIRKNKMKIENENIENLKITIEFYIFM